MEVAEIITGGICCVVTTCYTIHKEQNGGIDVRQVSSKLLKPPFLLLGQLMMECTHHQPPVRIGNDDLIQRTTLFITHPDPGTVLGACLLMGCSLSLFMQQRQEKDRYQSLVFLVVITWAVILGKRLGTSANMVALSLVPWALCLGMLLSFVGHALARGLSGRTKRVDGHRDKLFQPEKS